MAVRFRKYFGQCKPIACNGKKGKQCPELPKEKSCGGWAIEYREFDGRWVSKIFAGIGKTQAQEFLEEIKSKVRKRIVGLPDNKKIPLLGEYAEQYMCLSAGNMENTVANKKAILGILVKRFGNCPLDKVTSFKIQRFQVEREKIDGVKNSTINANVEVLNCLLNQAVRDGLITENPCSQVGKLRVSQTRKRVLNAEEISLLLNLSGGRDRLAVLFGLLYGLRLNEVLKLRWVDFDFAKGLLTFTPSKTGKLLSLPLSDFMVKALADFKSTCATDYLFIETATRSKILGYSKYFSEMFTRLGLHGVTFHILRHTFCSLLQADLGIGAVVTQHLLGHADLSVTSRYSHAGLDNKRQAIELLSRHVENMVRTQGVSTALQA